jgi:hypothetical protein
MKLLTILLVGICMIGFGGWLAAQDEQPKPEKPPAGRAEPKPSLLGPQLEPKFWIPGEKGRPARAGRPSIWLEPTLGFEPRTCGLRNHLYGKPGKTIRM